jgi:integrase
VASARERNGRWTGLYRGQDGKQRSAGTYDTKKAAIAHAAAKEAGIPAPVEVPREVRAGTVREYAETWVETHGIQAPTRQGYRGMLRKHVLPVIGDRALSRVTPEHMRGLFRSLEAKGMSGASLVKVHTICRAMFRTALEDARITTNPMAGIKTRGEVNRAMRILSPEQYTALIKATPGQYKLLVRTAVSTGCRLGELMEMRPEDIRGNTLVVSRTVQVMNRPRVYLVKQGTKNGKSRTVRITPEQAQELREAAQPGQLLFTRPGGRYLPQNDNDGWWKRATKAAGIEGVRFHDLRHTAISWWVHAGMPIENARDRAGHSSLAITSRYVHSREDAEVSVLEALGAVLKAA